MKFEDLSINDTLKNDLNNNGITTLTKVQEKTIPLILEKKDVIVQSETGSGKTLCFAVPTIQNIKQGGGVQVLVIAPTRELAKQVSEEYSKFSRSKRLRVAVCYGGASINDQAGSIRSAEVVVGTPGRLLDLLKRNMLNLSYAEFLVIDEADRLMDMGFIDDINTIIKYMTNRKQTLMFSATINKQVFRLIERYLNNPSKVLLENTLDKGVLEQVYYNVDENRKLSLLVHLLKKIERDLAIIFCNTKSRTRFVSEVLRINGINSACLNGDMTQALRERTMNDFSKGRTRVLVATDVAARGLHIENITHVFNYDLHESLETYTHRIGRTARNGKKGTSIILLSDNDWQCMDKIMREYKSGISEKKAGITDIIKMPQRRISAPSRFQSFKSGRPSSRPFMGRR